MQTTLILAAKQGDEDALEALYRQYRPLVYSLRKKYFIKGNRSVYSLCHFFMDFYSMNA